MERVSIILILASFLLKIGWAQQGLSAEEILAKIDKNMTFDTLYTETKMVITVGGEILSKTFRSYTEGPEKAFIEFLSPDRDRGIKMLKIGKVLKIYFPSAGQAITLSHSMLRQRMMGSDFSYEDITERAATLKNAYHVKLQGEDEFREASCYVLDLESRDQNKTYFRQKIWIDKEIFIGLKSELYARSGKLLKVLTVEEIGKFRDRHYPTRFTIRDILRADSKTEIIIQKIEFNIPLPAEIFTEANLKRG